MEEQRFPRIIRKFDEEFDDKTLLQYEELWGDEKTMFVYTCNCGKHISAYSIIQLECRKVAHCFGRKHKLYQ